MKILNYKFSVLFCDINVDLKLYFIDQKIYVDSDSILSLFSNITDNYMKFAKFFLRDRMSFGNIIFNFRNELDKVNKEVIIYQISPQNYIKLYAFGNEEIEVYFHAIINTRDSPLQRLFTERHFYMHEHFDENIDTIKKELINDLNEIRFGNIL